MNHQWLEFIQAILPFLSIKTNIHADTDYAALQVNTGCLRIYLIAGETEGLHGRRFLDLKIELKDSVANITFHRQGWLSKAIKNMPDFLAHPEEVAEELNKVIENPWRFIAYMEPSYIREIVQRSFFEVRSQTEFLDIFAKMTYGFVIQRQKGYLQFAQATARRFKIKGINKIHDKIKKSILAAEQLVK